ncbi:MAG: hypothetical protein ABMA00_22760, partial [Gemmatimonas sp.]
MSDRPRLDAAQWDRIADCFEQALLLPAEARAEFVATVLRDEPVARAELDAVLAEHERGRPLSIEDWLVTDTPATEQVMPAGTRVGAYRV